MTRALAILLFVAGIGMAAWALLAPYEAPNATEQTAGQAANAAAPPASSAESKPAPADQAQPNAAEASPETTGAVQPSGGSPLDTAKKAAKGSLKSPYSDFASVADEGHQKFMAAGCNGCHGGTGGGGMGPPLTNPIWIYGSDDDTLFRLVALGTDEFQKQGYSRKGSEAVVGPMPQMGTVVKSDDDLWKIIAWIRSVNPSSAGGSPTAATPPVSSPPQ